MVGIPVVIVWGTRVLAGLGYLGPVRATVALWVLGVPGMPVCPGY